MSEVYPWAVLRDGEIVNLHQTELGAKRAAGTLKKYQRKHTWTVRRVRDFFDGMKLEQVHG